MEISAKERAEQLAADPKVKAWIKRFQALARSMPENVMVFVASSTPCVLALDKNGQQYTTSCGGLDPDAEIDGANGGRWTGGDW